MNTLSIAMSPFYPQSLPIEVSQLSFKINTFNKQMFACPGYPCLAFFDPLNVLVSIYFGCLNYSDLACALKVVVFQEPSHCMLSAVL